MNFIYKCFLQQVFSRIPYGERLNYVFQKNVTRTLPISDEKFLATVNSAFDHYLKFREHNSLKNLTHKYYEFGAGWDLTTPITMGLLGFEVSCIDIRRLATDELVNDTIKKFLKNRASLPFISSGCLGDDNKKRYSVNDLQKLVKVNYSAPADARKTNFESESFDFIVSSDTLQHIPPQDLFLILLECHRILRRGGVFSITIDYQDHWSYFDKAISIYNFLKFSEKEWGRYNPPLHYQNRLRHKDYVDMINRTNFEIVQEFPFLASDNQMQLLEAITIDDKFKKYSLRDLSITGSMIVLRK